MSKNTYFHIIYDGPSLDSNEMDIKELAPALLAISEALEETNRIFNRGRAEISVNVKGSFKTGCFGIDLSVTQDLLSNLLNFLKTDNVVSGATLIAYLGFGIGVTKTTGKGLLHVIKWLKNRKISKITIEDDKATIFVSDDFLTVEKEIIELLKNYKIRKAIEKAIVTPLQNEGINSFSCSGQLQDTSDAKFFDITVEEIEYFVAPEPKDEEIDENTYETNLQTVSVSFLESNKWRFTDGSNTFHAKIADKKFIEQVQNNDISFAKDDIIRVLLHTKQTLTSKGIKTDYTVKKVISHRSTARQLSLPME